jgi:AAA domain-containing protein
MRPPAAAVIGHLVWSRTGKVWAVWRVKESPYKWLSTRRKLAEHSRVRTLLAGLPAESAIISVAARIDPGEVAEAMIGGIDLVRHSGWVDAVESTLDRLETTELYRRRHYLCVQLPTGKRNARWRDVWRAASASVLSAAGLAAPPIPSREVDTALRHAAELEAQLGTLQLDRVSTGELRWLYARSARRGLAGEPHLAGWIEPRLRWHTRNGEPVVSSPSLAPLLDGRYQEGGDADDVERPLHRRYLRITTDEGVSYQTFATVADAPQRFAFPGGLSEWLYVADQLPFPVDWVCRIKAVPNHVATRAATRQQRELVGQVPEYEHEPAGPPPSLAAALDAVDDERAALAANPSEPELQVAMVFGVWAPTLGELEQRAMTLQRIYKGAEYHLPRPTGGQLALFEGFLPGSVTPQPCHDYRQYLLPRDLAAGMPFAGSTVGDTGGMLLGASRDAGCARPVLLDPASGPRNDRDGSMAAFGTLGSGKSYLAKRLAATVLMRGGKMVLIDRTQAGEYVRFAATMSEVGVRAQVLTVSDEGGLLLDPLRVFSPTMARQVALGYLGLVCGLDPTSLESAALDKAVGNVAERGGRLLDVLAELEVLAETGAEFRHGRELALRLRAIANNRFGAPAWKDGPSIDDRVDCTVIHLPNLAVPRREVLLSEHLSRKLLPEQVCSLGLLYLVAALARGVIFEEPGRFAALGMDEAWALTSTLSGQQLLEEVLRDGRKHNAAAWVFSQNPEDLPRELRDLISVRFVFGLSGDAASAGLHWLGIDPTRDNVDVLEQWAARREVVVGPDEDVLSAPLVSAPPECLLRDASGRVGRIQVLDAETDLLRVGFESNPTRIAARGAVAGGEHELDPASRASLPMGAGAVGAP